MSLKLRIPSSFKLSRFYLLTLFILGVAVLKLVKSGRLNQFENMAEAAAFVPNDLADYIEAIALDDSGAIYVVGKTTSEHFPLVNPFQSTYGGGESDGFIAVFAPDGQSLQHSTYIGGSDFDIIKDIAISNTGHVIVAGATGSDDFPLANPYQSNLDAVDGFVMVFEPDFLGLVYSTYIGGSDWDFPHDLAVDSTGSVYLTGYTHSNNFPLVNSIQPYQGQEDVFVTGFAPDGQALIYSTYVGGSGNERASEIVLDTNGRKYITGYTESLNFPVVNAYQPVNNGLGDSFVNVLSADGQTIEMSTFLGGSSFDRASSIGLGNYNQIYVGGGTLSADFPVMKPYQPIKNTGWDGFVAIFNPDGQSLTYSTFLGGNAADSLQNIALNDFGRVFVVGYTFSTNFPLVNPLQPSPSGFNDIFLTSFAADGQSLFYSTYLGGSEGDVAYSLSLDDKGVAYIGGSTWSGDFPIINPYQPNITGYVDGLVSVLSADGQSLEYSTYLGSSYPSPTDVTLNDLTGEVLEDSSFWPTWLWLALALLIFFGATIFVVKFIGQYKK